MGDKKEKIWSKGSNLRKDTSGKTNQYRKIES